MDTDTSAAARAGRSEAAGSPSSESRQPARAQPLAEIDADDLAALLKALAHPARIEILRHLSQHRTCYFGDLSEVVGLAPSTTSQHVKVLKEAGLVIGSAEEQRTCYCINGDRLALLKRLVERL